MKDDAMIKQRIRRRSPHAIAKTRRTSQTATPQIVEAQAPRQTGTDRIEAALNASLTDQRGRDKPY
jgi:hypothetical protein